MNIVKIKNLAGRDIFINIDNISYLALDLMDTSHVQIHLSNTFHIVKGTIEDTIKLLQGNNK